jgi:acyl-CoA synthetase (AMP-forming)/AMP-acid ligase II
MGNPTGRISTLADLLRFRARMSPDHVFCTVSGNEISCSRLWQDANAFAAGLKESGLGSGERILIALPNGVDFFIAFYGILLARCIAIPVFPTSDDRRLFSLAATCTAKGIVDQPAQGPKRVGPKEKDQRRREIRRISTEETLCLGRASHLPFPDIMENDIAYIQFTSGTSGTPKGVMVSHANLLANIRQMIPGFGIGDDDIFVSWLPACHDMGLILMTMVPLFLGIPLVLLPSTLKNLANWLRAIEAHRATFTAAPDFGYRFCLAYVSHPEQYDLSSLRIALNASEPVRRKTIRDFETLFNLKHVMTPAYGLAEATLGVTAWPCGRQVKVDPQGMVSVGRPFPDIFLRIGKSSGSEAAPGERGEILVKSPANTLGYWHDSRATHRLFTADGFLKTGDLGYLDDEGDLFIFGRKKNMIVQAGRTIAPHEVEGLVDTLPFVRRSAAIGIDEGGMAGEQVLIFIELRTRRNTSALPPWRIRQAVVQLFHRYFGFRPGKVHVMKPGSLPFTRNGKLRHLRLKKMYCTGALMKENKIIAGPITASPCRTCR